MAQTIPSLFPRETDTDNIFFRINRQQLVFLNGLVESYDDLGVLKTLDSSSGLAVLMASPGCGQTARELLRAESGPGGVEFLEPGDPVLEDWRETIYGT